jgi:hypothetical protein
LSRDEIGLFEGIDEFAPEDDGFALVFTWEKGFIIREFTSKESGGDPNLADTGEKL